MKTLLLMLTVALGAMGLAGLTGDGTTWLAGILLSLALGGLIGALMIDRAPDALPSFSFTLAAVSGLVGLGGVATRATTWLSEGALGAAFALVVLGAVAHGQAARTTAEA